MVDHPLANINFEAKKPSPDENMMLRPSIRMICTIQKGANILPFDWIEKEYHAIQRIVCRAVGIVKPKRPSPEGNALPKPSGRLIYTIWKGG